MLYLAIAEIVQERLPVPVLGEIIRHAPREQDVPGVTAIHHPLRSVNSAAGDIGALVYIRDLVDGPTVNSHAHPNLPVSLQRLADLQRAMSR